jgi:hypothetical protein
MIKLLLLHKTAYAKKIISNFKMSECKPVKTLLPRDCNLSLMVYSPDEVDPRVQSDSQPDLCNFKFQFSDLCNFKFQSTQRARLPVARQLCAPPCASA